MHGAYPVGSLDEESPLDLAQPPTVPPCHPAERAHVLEHEIELRPAAPDREARVGEQVDAGACELRKHTCALARAVGNDRIAVVDLFHSVCHERLLVGVGMTAVGRLWVRTFTNRTVPRTWIPVLGAKGPVPTEQS
jgi:hypothetical protein